MPKILGGVDEDVLKRYRRNKPDTKPKPKPGDIVSWDKQPKATRDRPGQGGRTITRILRNDDPDYVRVGLNPQDWYEFSKQSFVDRFNQGTITIENPFELLAIVRDWFIDHDKNDAAAAVGRILDKYGS